MQGLQALDQFKNFVSKIGGLGRYEDTYIVHAAEGETVVPMEVLDQNPVLKKRLFKTMMEMGIEPGRYIVGNELNSKNPVTGQPEFFLKKIVSQIRKALPGDSEKYLGTIVGLATGNPYLGAIAGGVGSGMEGAIGGGLTGFQSPGISGLGGGFRDVLGGDTLFGRDKVSAMKFRDIIKDKAGLSRFFLGEGNQSGLIGKGGEFFGGSGATEDVKKLDIDDFAKSFGFDNAAAVPDGMKSEFSKAFFGQASKEAKKAGMTMMDYLKMIGFGGLFLQQFEDDSDIGPKPYEYAMTNESYPGVINQSPVYGAQGGEVYAAEGGIIQNYDRGGLTGNPHKERPDRIPLTDELKDQMYDFLLNFMMKKRIEEDEENRMRLPKFNPNKAIEVADGGIMDLRDGGASNGPGTGTSDSIPAMLSDGEFVMTAKAVRGAGGGDRREGAKKMYEAMDRLEARV